MKLLDVITELNVGHLERLHTSKEPIDRIQITSQTGPRIEGKPNGFWYSFGKQWMLYSRDEMSSSHFSNENYVYKVYPDLTKMIVIDSYDTAYRFSAKYAYHTGKGVTINHDIYWEEVAKEYAGIELQVYHDLRNAWRQDPIMGWIYNWDVDSGCIWHPSGLIRLKLLGHQSSVENLPKSPHMSF